LAPPGTVALAGTEGSADADGEECAAELAEALLVALVLAAAGVVPWPRTRKKTRTPTPSRTTTTALMIQGSALRFGGPP
jgi:hypothetical protein